MPISDFFSFLGSGEQQILNRILALLDSSIDSTEHLLTLVKYLKTCDYEAVDRQFTVIDGIEKKIDDEHRALVRVLCKGSFFGGIREDLLSLSELIENISDASKHSAMVFHDLRLPKEVIDYFFMVDVESFVSTCISAARLLREAIVALEKNKEEVLSTAEKVEEKETEADGIHHSIVQHLYKNEIDAKSLDIILLKDFLSLVDKIADMSEHGSDILLILVAKGYS